MCDHVGHEIAGRKADVHLNDLGRAQALSLAERLDGVPIDAIVTSPLPRAAETAAPLAERRQLVPMVDDALTEIDYGDWTGRSVEALRAEGAFTRYNSVRSIARVPNGELMLEVQARTITALEAHRRRHPEGCIAVVSHADVIRAIVAHCAGISLDLFQRLEVAPASVSLVVIAESWIGVRVVNLPLEGLASLFG